MKKLLCCITTLLIISCQKEPVVTLLDGSTEIQRSFPGVDEALWIHFQQFEKEGAIRGMDIDLVREGITGVIERIHEDNVIGTCNYYSYRPNHVTIDQGFWNSASSLYREYVVFHELGHCYLDRPHDETEVQNGICASIMNSGAGTCSARYNTVNRTIYLNELF